MPKPHSSLKRSAVADRLQMGLLQLEELTFVVRRRRVVIPGALLFQGSVLGPKWLLVLIGGILGGTGSHTGALYLDKIQCSLPKKCIRRGQWAHSLWKGGNGIIGHLLCCRRPQSQSLAFPIEKEGSGRCYERSLENHC